MSEKSKKSKLPDINECTTIASKLYKDIKQSVSEIITDYKDKRAEDVSQPDKQENAQPKSEENQSTHATEERKKPDHEGHSDDKEK